jgi:hypothetical protein
MSRRSCLPCVALLAACAALAGPCRHAGAAPAPLLRTPKVEVVFCIDTTGSMGGYIDFFKQRIWYMCNQLANARPVPDLKVGFVDYRDKGDSWITKVYDLTDDLDHIYSTIQTFRADQGGDAPESVNQALFDSVNKIKWSKDPKTLRIIYLIGDAPPHMDYTDDVKYPITCKEAVKRGILINPIQCGNDAECLKYWKDIATQARGSYMQLHNSGVAFPTTPFDRRLSEINSELTRSLLIWGATAKRDADARKVREAGAMTVTAAADRAGYFAKKGRTASYDLLDAIRTGQVKLESVKADELPAELSKLDIKDRREFIDKVAKRRSELRREATELDKKRMAFLATELAKNKTNLEHQLIESLRAQAKKFNLKY